MLIKKKLDSACERSVWFCAPHGLPHLDLLELINIPPSSGTINLDHEEAHYGLIVQMFHINII